MEEVFRFPNHPYKKGNHLFWDLDAIVVGMKRGIRKAFEAHPDITSIGIDTFGVDYVRLGKDGQPLEHPFCYRDDRCQTAMEALLKLHPYKEIYAKTGIQRLPFNTIFQLYDDHLNGRPYEEMLFLPDYLNYFLTGIKRSEKTIASTGALLNLDREFDPELLQMAGYSSCPFPKLIEAGEVLGPIKKELAEELGIPSIDVIVTASHDTGSAVAAIDLDEHTAYLSSGTWSLLGVERKNVEASEASFQNNFTNELGYRESNRYLKNIMGLFIIQELFNAWKGKDQCLSFSLLAKEAGEAKELPIFIDVDDPLFASPLQMEEKFYSYLEATNQQASNLSRGEIARIVYESMSLAYKKQFEKLNQLEENSLKRIVVVGGGSKAELLNQFIADALQIEVVTGQSEATAYGNALVQYLALKEFASWEQARAKMIPSDRKSYLPKQKKEERYGLYQELIARRKQS